MPLGRVLGRQLRVRPRGRGQRRLLLGRQRVQRLRRGEQTRASEAAKRSVLNGPSEEIGKKSHVPCQPRDQKRSALIGGEAARQQRDRGPHLSHVSEAFFQLSEPATSSPAPHRQRLNHARHRQRPARQQRGQGHRGQVHLRLVPGQVRQPLRGQDP